MPTLFILRFLQYRTQLHSDNMKIHVCQY